MHVEASKLLGRPHILTDARLPHTVFISVYVLLSQADDIYFRPLHLTILSQCGCHGLFPHDTHLGACHKPISDSALQYIKPATNDSVRGAQFVHMRCSLRRHCAPPGQVSSHIDARSGIDRALQFPLCFADTNETVCHLSVCVYNEVFRGSSDRPKCPWKNRA